MKHSKTTMFLLPVLGLKGTIDHLIKDGFINSYLGWRKHLDNEYGTHLYVVFDKETLPYVRFEELDMHPNLTDIVVQDSTIVFIFHTGELFSDAVVRHFLQGKYSLIDREFANTYHPVLLQEGNYTYIKNPARMALDKDPELREYWAERIGIELPPDAELWGKPDPSEEILDYFTQIADS